MQLQVIQSCSVIIDSVIGCNSVCVPTDNIPARISSYDPDQLDPDQLSVLYKMMLSSPDKSCNRSMAKRTLLIIRIINN